MMITIDIFYIFFYHLQYNTIQYKTYNAPYVTKMLFVGVLTLTDVY